MQCGAGDGDCPGTPCRAFGDTHLTPAWPRERSHGSVQGAAQFHMGACSPQRCPGTSRLRGRWEEASPYLLSLCANTRALLEPPCDAASRKAAKAGRLPSFCLLPSRCGWPCQADGSAPARDERRRQEQLAPSVPGPRAEMLSRAGSSREASEAVTSRARLRLCRAPLGSALTWGVLPAPAPHGGPGRGVGWDQRCPGGDRCLLGTAPKPRADAGTSRTYLLQRGLPVRQRGRSCTLEQLGLGAEEPQGGPCSKPSAAIPGLLLAAWANDLLGNQQTSWKPC